jgi:hypothetical protein
MPWLGASAAPISKPPVPPMVPPLPMRRRPTVVRTESVTVPPKRNTLPGECYWAQVRTCTPPQDGSPRGLLPRPMPSARTMLERAHAELRQTGGKLPELPSSARGSVGLGRGSSSGREGHPSALEVWRQSGRLGENACGSFSPWKEATRRRTTTMATPLPEKLPPTRDSPPYRIRAALLTPLGGWDTGTRSMETVTRSHPSGRTHGTGLGTEACTLSSNELGAAGTGSTPAASAASAVDAAASTPRDRESMGASNKSTAAAESESAIPRATAKHQKWNSFFHLQRPRRLESRTSVPAAPWQPRHFASSDAASSPWSSPRTRRDRFLAAPAPTV